jgi:hypothetical protein
MAAVGDGRITEALPGRNPVVIERRFVAIDNMTGIISARDTCSKKPIDLVAPLTTR